MGEAWHQHLQNLTWWEQIDRFFNPGKYSCTTVTFLNPLWFIVPIVIAAIVLVWLVIYQFELWPIKK
jgi:hypothetical protein